MKIWQDKDGKYYYSPNINPKEKTKMKIYRTKSKMFGYKIGLDNDALYVAVAKKYFYDPKYGGVVKIVCDDGSKIVTEKDKEAEATFKDKFKFGENYTIYYFKWCD